LGDVWPLEAASISAEHARLEIERGPLVEWFVNEPRGIEQGWTIAARPAGANVLVIRMALGGGLELQLEADGQSGSFVDADGEVRTQYGGLAAWDATGRALELRMIAQGAGLEVHVDDSAAQYPITVDPLMTTPDWIAEVDLADAEFGYSVASAGDLNADGFDDDVVGARFFDDGSGDAGRAFLYYGSANGLQSTPAWIGRSDHPGANAETW
jgi:hypothetical protein